MRIVHAWVAGVMMALCAGGFAQTATEWTQLSLSTCKVDEFLKSRPTSDGRGVVVAVLDSGVDPSIPGLTHTPEGQIKVIDVQDFTGAGDAELHRVRSNEAGTAVLHHDDNGAGIEYAIPGPAGDEGRAKEERLYWFGSLDEKRFVNSSVPDLNDNGTRDDKFSILVTALTGDGDDQAVCYVDTNLDRSFADEKPLKNYKLAFDMFTFFRERPEKQIVPLTLAVNIFLRQSKVIFHFDDGAHGTHVAGIAAGYRINGQDGFNGVAPGAKIISLKIGNNSLGGVSTTESKKKAFEYAARYAREHGVPVVCNLSYGVDSTVEGHSDIDAFLDEGLRKNPYLIFCASGGNAGPGVSTMGTPAASAEVLTVGALLAADTARDVPGFALTGPLATLFSARGGEVDKPDVACPGWSTSTVPRWVRQGDYWSGTSMASPYAAGLCAVLISDAMARHPGVPIRARDVRLSLCQSSRMLPDHTPLDLGWGVPDLSKAAEILNSRVPASKDDPLIGYKIEAAQPHAHRGVTAAAYWRGPWFPKNEPQTFTVRPLFSPDIGSTARTDFTRKFSIRSNADWCMLTQKEVYLRSEQAAEIYVGYDASKLTRPGLYVGTVEAIWQDRVAFRLLNTIVIPDLAHEKDGYRQVFRDQIVGGWIPRRHFLYVPGSASAMHVTLSAPDETASRAGMTRIFNPLGHQHRSGEKRLDPERGVNSVAWILSEDLMPGVWEIDIAADRPDRDWPYELSVRLVGLDAKPKLIAAWVKSGPSASGTLTVMNNFDRPVAAVADGTLEGFREHKEAEFKGLADELVYTVTLGPESRGLRIDLSMTEEAYAATTDIGVRVEDSSGKSIFTAAFDNHEFVGTASHPNPGGETTVTVKIKAGFTNADDQRKTPIAVNLDRLLASAIPIKVTRGDSSNIDFLPALPMKLDFSLSAPLPTIPDGTRPVGYLRFRERGTNDEVLRVKLDIGA